VREEWKGCTVTGIDDRDYTLGQLFDLIEESGAGLLKIIFRDENDTPLRGIIAFDGAETGEPIVKAVEALEKAWEIE